MIYLCSGHWRTSKRGTESGAQNDKLWRLWRVWLFAIAAAIRQRSLQSDEINVTYDFLSVLHLVAFCCIYALGITVQSQW